MVVASGIAPVLPRHLHDAVVVWAAADEGLHQRIDGILVCWGSQWCVNAVLQYCSNATHGKGVLVCRIEACTAEFDRHGVEHTSL